MAAKTRQRPRVFLDTNVVLAILRGDKSARMLITKDALKKVQLAVNPIVLQELLLLGEAKDHPEILNALQEHWTVLPIDDARVRELVSEFRALRNMLVHSNDLLIVSSAEQCDFLVTYDRDLQQFVRQRSRPKAVTPEQLVTQLGSGR